MEVEYACYKGEPQMTGSSWSVIRAKQDRFRRWVAEGKTVAEITRLEYGDKQTQWSDGQVRRNLRNLGLVAAPGKHTGRPPGTLTSTAAGIVPIEDRRKRVAELHGLGMTTCQIARKIYGVEAVQDGYKSAMQRTMLDMRAIGVKPVKRNAVRIVDGPQWGEPDVDGISEHLPCHWSGCDGCRHQGGRRIEVQRPRVRAEHFARTGRMEHAGVSGLPRGAW
jgi:hypothetical protein